MDIRRVDGPTADLGEGPLWDADRACLWWVDIPTSMLHCLNPANETTRSVTCDEPFLSMVVLGDAGELVVATERGIGVIDPRDGSVSRHGHLTPDNGVRMNDGNVDPNGRLWVGSMHHDFVEGAAALYVMERGDHQLVLDNVTCSNGITWSPDGTTMYYVDTFAMRLDAFDADVTTGAVSARRTLVEFDPARGGPDGIAIDADGAIWVALWDGGALQRYLPDGSKAGEIDMPVSRPTCPEFGGDDLDVLFVTAAADDQSPGGLFRIDGVGVCGTQPARYRR